MDDAPTPLYFAVDLGFAAVSPDRLTVFSEFGVEVPIELGPSCVSVNVNRDVARREFSFGKSFSHQTLIDVLFDLVETSFVT